MDAGVYDHIQEEALKEDPSLRAAGASGAAHTHSPSVADEPGSLATDLQDTYNSFTASPWGARLGGLWGSVNKQAASYLQEATKEASVARDEALRGFEALRTSLEGRARGVAQAEGEGTASGEKKVEGEGDTGVKEKGGDADAQEPTSPAFIARFRTEASKRLQDLQKAEDAADEALLKFGTNIRNFLRDAVTVTAPGGGAGGGDGLDGGAAGNKAGTVLFESKDAEGKRVIHTSRFDAQLHVIHCSLDSFTKDPVSPEYAGWADGFNIVNKTDEITEDLKKYDELRKAMERLVPEKVDYLSFWRRYYFLRMVIESEEKRRREMLKEAANKPDDATLAWDSDEEGPSTPQPRISSEQNNASTPLASSSHLKEPRKSHDEKSTAGSESSYDLVSGATSAAPGSPQNQEKKDDRKKGKGSESDDDDWE